MVATAHGRLPVPSPATLELLRGRELEEGQASERRAHHADGRGPHPVPRDEAGRARPLWSRARRQGARRGRGAGTRETPGRPNLLRVIALDAGPVAPDTGNARADVVEVLEANIDDLTPSWPRRSSTRCWQPVRSTRGSPRS